MKEIRGEAKTIRQLLNGSRYSIDYYQREYKWQTKQVRELLEDLTESFLEHYDATHERAAVQDYGHYFLGSIILSRRGNDTFIIDGQQRLTTLTLLLTHLHRCQQGIEGAVSLDELIFSEKYGSRSFNIDVDERAPAMEALYSGTLIDLGDAPESVQNMAARYADIQELFPQDIGEHAMPYFADWLIENVHLVEITAFADDDAYAIFETMNDRGLSLTPLDMLKGYVLANIADEARRLHASHTWKKRVSTLDDIGKDEAADAVKAWLRSQFAKTIRERRKNAQPGDFDRLGTEFHRWVRENATEIGLTSTTAFADFVEREMSFYLQQYARIRAASREMTAGLEEIYFNARLEFTLQYPLLLAPLVPGEDDDTIDRKLRAVATYVDILVARRLWNWRSIAYSTMQYAMFVVMREIRQKPLDELVEVLTQRLDEAEETFTSNERFALHQMNRPAVRQILARLTEHVERQAGQKSRFEEYVAEGKNRYEVEHIWADMPDRHEDEFAHPTDFREYRNRIGGLLLLPKSFNASYGALTYEGKLPHYLEQNLLAKSLHPQSYQHNPGFIGYVQRSGIPFVPHETFKKADLEARQALYRQLAEEVWNPARIAAVAEEAVEAA